jgi:hypothetical protein
LKWN